MNHQIVCDHEYFVKHNFNKETYSIGIKETRKHIQFFINCGLLLCIYEVIFPYIKDLLNDL